jgi:hypothetical protein
MKNKKAGLVHKASKLPDGITSLLGNYLRLCGK